MPRSWKTVYRSPRKRVMVRQPKSTAPTPAQSSDDDSLMPILASLGIVVFAAAFWPYVLAIGALVGLVWLFGRR